MLSAVESAGAAETRLGEKVLRMMTQVANRGPGQWRVGGGGVRVGGRRIDRGLSEDKESKLPISAQKKTTQTDHSKQGEAYQKVGLGPSRPTGPDWGGAGVDKVLERRELNNLPQWQFSSQPGGKRPGETRTPTQHLTHTKPHTLQNRNITILTHTSRIHRPDER